MSTTQALPKCQICGHTDHWLGDHIEAAHDLSLDDYLDQFPAHAVVSSEVVDRLEAKRIKREHPPAVNELMVNVCSVPLRLNAGVPEMACLKMPHEYRFPTQGDLALDCQEAAIALKKRRHLYIWGLSGTGKDGFIHAISAATRWPAKKFQIIPGADIEPWLYSQSFDQNGTSWEYGDLLLAARDGYVTEDGERVPYLILITDGDRATKSQAEILRLILDSIEGRIPGPSGETFKVLPGTVIVMTANTAGGGDERMRYTSANVLDASLMGRFERKLEFHFMEWEDEEKVIRSKFPLFSERCGAALEGIGKATQALRQKIMDDELAAEFSHRDLCNFVGHADDILSLDPTGKVPRDLMRRAARMVLDGMPDSETRLEAARLMSPHIPGGILDEGDRSGENKSSDFFGS